MEGSILSAAERTELVELYGRLKAGDREAIERWCQIGEKIIAAIVKKMDLSASAYPGGKDDLEQDGRIVVFGMANAIRNGKYDDIRDVAAYVYSSVWKAVTEQVQWSADSYGLPNIPDDFDALVEQSSLSEEAALMEHQETKEHLMSLCTTPLEQKIVEDEGRGKMADIATEAGLEYRRVLRDRQTFLDRVGAAYTADGEDGKLGRPTRGRKPAKAKTTSEWAKDSPLKSPAKAVKASPLSSPSKPPGNK